MRTTRDVGGQNVTCRDFSVILHAILFCMCTQNASSARFACFSCAIHSISEPWIMPPKSFGPESWSLETESVLTASVTQSSTHICSLLCAYRTGMLKRSGQQHAVRMMAFSLREIPIAGFLRGADFRRRSWAGINWCINLITSRYTSRAVRS